MNYLQIKNAIEGYLHRNDMDQQIELGIFLANIRIGRSLRHSSNLITTPFMMNTETSNLPSDFREIKTAWNTSAAMKETLQLVGMDQLANLQYSSGQPGYIAIELPLVAIKPFSAPTEIQLVYWSEPVSPTSDTDENRVMLELPQLYIYGALMEAFFWTHDGDLTRFAIDAFNREIDQANLANQSAATGSNRMMRRY